MKIKKGLSEKNHLQKVQKNLPPEMPSDDFVVTNSIFPSHDELGRLICKECGQPYKSWTIEGLLEKELREPDDVGFIIFNCLSCRKVSVFWKDEILRYQYNPVKNISLSWMIKYNFSIIYQFFTKLFSSNSISNESGHLVCQLCRKPVVGFTVKGALALLNQSEKKVLSIACEKCRRISIFEVSELRRVLPETPVCPLKLGETLLNFPILAAMSGGMGIVYLCKSPSGLLAVKTLKPKLSQSSEVEARFRREAEAWILLDYHPNIVKAQVLSWDKGRSVLAMDYQEGGSLGRLLAKRRLSIEEIIEFSIHFCNGMEHARSIFPNFVHRDIKPDNCLIGGDGILRVSDFGLVRVFEELSQSDYTNDEEKELANNDSVFHTRLGEFGKGTLPYMAPEQFCDFSSVNVKADVYSFGVMLFQMVTGYLPISLKTNKFEDWYEAHTSTPIPYASDDRTSVPHKLSELIQFCMAKNPEDRPQHFGYIIDILSSIQKGTSEHKYNENEAGNDVEQLDMLRVFNLMNIGQTSMALEYSEKIIRVASNSTPEKAKKIQARGYAFRAMVLEKMDKLLEATKDADKALELNVEDPLALYQRGWLANHEGDFQTAVDCLERSYNLEPERNRLAFELAFAYNAVGEYNRAIPVLKDEIEKVSDEYINHREIGYSYLHTKQFELAKTHYEQAFSLCSPFLDSERAEIAYNLAQVFLNTGNKKDGEQWYSKIPIKLSKKNHI